MDFSLIQERQDFKYRIFKIIKYYFYNSVTALKGAIVAVTLSVG